MTRAKDALAAERRRMPWVEVTKEYAFDGPDGRVSLLELFVAFLQAYVFTVLTCIYLNDAKNATIKAQSGMSLEAAGQMTVKGATVAIN